VAPQKGRAVLIKYNTGTTIFAAIGGAREITLTIANEPVDVTNADSAGVRQLLEGAGVNSVSIKLQGVYVDDAALEALRTDAATNVHRKFQLTIPGTNTVTYEGIFMIASFEEAGSYNGAMTYNITLESASAVTIT
jgi:TP901-1 family phage major tail protein